jgi:short-chain fatty acids transporter
MMKKVIHFFTRLCEAYLPDAFVFCLVLTLIVFIAAVVVTPHSPLMLIEFWGKDFWSLHAFSMQMVFVLITGHMLATTPLVKKILLKISHSVKSEAQGLILLSIFSVLGCWINWGFGLIVSGILAIEIAKKLGKVNFGLFIATAYAGFLVWHGGLSGSIPLKIAGQDEILNRVYPTLSVPLSLTIFSNYNLLIVLLLLFVLPIVAICMRTDDKIVIPFSEDAEEEIFVSQTFRDQLENGRFFNWIFFGLFLVVFFKLKSSFDINRINLIFLSLAFFLHGTPRKFLNALQRSIGYSSGIIIQFPFYAGLMGLMQYSGLADTISEIFVRISTVDTLPVWTFLSGGIVNFFIPSGGGQWVVQGPIMLKAAQNLNADPGKISMALAWGDAWTNMIQPFWALPLLGLAKIQLKDIMGYCLIYTFVSGIIITGVLYFF